MRSPSGSEPVREPEEVLFVDGVEHHDTCALDDLVLQGRDRQRPLPPVRLRYVRPAGGLWVVGSLMDPSVQIPEPGLELRLVVQPRHAIRAGGGFALERVKRRQSVSTLMWWRSQVNCSFFLCLAACRTRLSAW